MSPTPGDAFDYYLKEKPKADPYKRRKQQVLIGIDDGDVVAVPDGDLAAGEQVVTARLPRPSASGLFGIEF